MKKNYLIVSLVQTFIRIALVVLFPIVANSQDLTAGQKQERCQNNKDRIIELETQLSNVNAELSQTWSDEEFTKARDKMVFVKGVKAKGKLEDLEWTKLRTIGAQYDYNLDTCYAHAFVGPTGVGTVDERKIECTSRLGNFIADEINNHLLLKDKRPELINKKNEIDNQLAAHRNNLVALGCDAINKGTPDISGTWKAFNWIYEFKQNGKTFSWKITNDAVYNETANGEFLEGNTIKATWTNKNGTDSGNATVIVENDRAIRIEWSNGVVFTRN